MAATHSSDHHAPKSYGLGYYLKGALAGGICCSVTHGALCPVDVVKTRMQLDPQKYPNGMVATFRTIVKEEGTGCLATGLGPTAVGYFVQGWFKFGGVELFKINTAQRLGEERAWKNRTLIYLGSAAAAEFVADIFLCPLEATRIRLVSNPQYASGLLTAFPKIIREQGVMTGFYSGFSPMLFKQVPYTMAKFAVQGWASELIYRVSGTDVKKASEGKKMAIALGSGTVAGVAAAIVSHPADTLLSMINKSPTAGGTGSTMSRLSNLAKQVGFKKLCLTGLIPRCVMIGTLTAGQFAIFDAAMKVTGAEKFHFHEPGTPAH